MLENHWDGILAYFDEGRSSGPVEGLNTKLRVITRRGYGISSVTTLWTRALLDVNWAAKKVGKTIAGIRAAGGTHSGLFCRVLHLKTEEPRLMSILDSFGLGK